MGSRSPDTERDRRYQRTFGLSLAEYETLVEYQSGGCAICGRPPTTRRLAVDHSHKTGEVRGLLCMPCNYRLGEQVSVEWMQAAVAYLLEPPVLRAIGRTPVGIKGPVTRRKRRKKKGITT